MTEAVIIKYLAVIYTISVLDLEKKNPVLFKKISQILLCCVLWLSNLSRCRSKSVATSYGLLGRGLVPNQNFSPVTATIRAPLSTQSQIWYVQEYFCLGIHQPDFQSLERVEPYFHLLSASTSFVARAQRQIYLAFSCNGQFTWSVRSC
jgi:hypothetical protein